MPTQASPRRVPIVVAVLLERFAIVLPGRTVASLIASILRLSFDDLGRLVDRDEALVLVVVTQDLTGNVDRLEESRRRGIAQIDAIEEVPDAAGAVVDVVFMLAGHEVASGESHARGAPVPSPVPPPSHVHHASDGTVAPTTQRHRSLDVDARHDPGIRGL